MLLLSNCCLPLPLPLPLYLYLSLLCHPEEAFEEETEDLEDQEDLGEDDVPTETAADEGTGSRPEDSVPDVDEDEVIRVEASEAQTRPSVSVQRQVEAGPSGRTVVAEGRPRLLSARHMAPFSFPQVRPDADIFRAFNPMELEWAMV